jgi:hypothetical protein
MSNPLNRLIKQLGYTGPIFANTTAPAAGAPAPAPAGASMSVPSLSIPSLALPSLQAWLKPLGIIAGILAVITVILLVIHYTYRPIFKTHPDSQGIIKVPFTSSGAKKFWEGADPVPIADSSVTLDRSITHNYSLTLDIIVLDPLKNITQYTPIFTRSGTGHIPTFPGNHNIAITLDKGKNDLIISTATEDTFESAILPNIPIRQPFTVGIVLGSNYMEVYMNGKLRQTKAFASVPRPISGVMTPPTAAAADVVKVKNLRIWPSAVSPAVMRDIGAPETSLFGDISADRVLGLLECRTSN